MLKTDLPAVLKGYFGAVPEDALEKLARASALSREAAGTVLYKPGDPADAVFLICPPASRAVVRVSFGAGAKARTAYHLTEMQLVGDVELLLAGLRASQRKRITTARMLAPAQLVKIPRAALIELLSSGEVLRKVVSEAAGHMLEVIEQSASGQIGHHDVDFANSLLELQLVYGGERTGGKLKFADRLRQGDIADMFGLELRQLSFRMSEWSSRGLLETVPLMIPDIRRVERIAAFAGNVHDALREAVADVDALIAARQLGAAGQAASDMLAIFPGNPVFAYQLALVCARTGAVAQAAGIMAAQSLAWDGSIAGVKDRLRAAWRTSLSARRAAADEVDEERQQGALSDLLERRLGELAIDVGALHARLAKEQLFALDAGTRAFEQQAAAAARLYRQVYEASPNHYCAVNAAALWRVVGDEVRARQNAEDAKRLAARERDSYWAAATAGEAELVLGRREEAAARFAAAMRQPDFDLAKLTSTRRQIGLLHVYDAAGAHASLAALDPGRPLVFSGTLMTPPKDGTPEQIAAAGKVLAGQIEEWLEGRRVPIAFSGAACGADLIFARAVIEAGIPLHIVLPFSTGKYFSESVEIGGKHLRETYEEVLRDAAGVTELWRDTDAATTIEHYYRQGNRHMAGEAIYAADALMTQPLMLAVMDGTPVGSIAGTRHLATEFSALGFDVDVIAPPIERRRPPPGPPARGPFAPVVFAFAQSQPDNAAMQGLLGGLGFATRTMKDKRLAGHRLCDDFTAALDLAISVLDKAGADGFPARVVCDFGPVRQRDGSASLDGVLRLEAAGDMTAVAVGGVFATSQFVMADVGTGGAPRRYAAISVALETGNQARDLPPRGSRTVYKYTGR